ncbi:MAG: hypothetical protein ACJAQ6_001642 [Arenicella sp.]|jgi:hypothetical protein
MYVWIIKVLKQIFYDYLSIQYRNNKMLIDKPYVIAALSLNAFGGLLTYFSALDVEFSSKN